MVADYNAPAEPPRLYGSEPVVKPMSNKTLQKLCDIAAEDITEMKEKSAVFRVASKKLETIAKYDRKNTDFGRVLGKGHFCTVKEIRSVRMGTLEEDRPEVDDHGMEVLQEDSTLENSNMHLGADAPKYVAKQLSKQLYGDKNDFYIGVRSLAIEAHFLAAVNHKHVIKLHGISSGDLCTKDAFIVLDKLDGSLHEKLVEWAARMRKFGGIRSTLLGNNKGMGIKKRQFWQERLNVALQVGSAVQYLHENNIIYRDLKSENIGLDPQGDVKIFDFGLSKEVDPTKGKPYKLTGMIGSWFYMAPEVYYEKPYDESVDIFALAIVLWQLMALERLYPSVSSTKILEADVMANGLRPKIDKEWPDSIKSMLEKMWSEDPEDRPSARHVQVLLSRELAKSTEDDAGEKTAKLPSGGFLRRRFTS